MTRHFAPANETDFSAGLGVHCVTRRHRSGLRGSNRGIHPAGWQADLRFPISTARRLCATDHFWHLFPSSDPICGSARHRTSVPTRQTPRGKAWRWLVGFRQRNLCIIINPTGAVIASCFNGAAPNWARKECNILLHNILSKCFNGAASVKTKRTQIAFHTINANLHGARRYYFRYSQPFSEDFATQILTFTTLPSRTATVITRLRCFSIESFQQPTEIHSRLCARFDGCFSLTTTTVNHDL
jgi:hypothetical protein